MIRIASSTPHVIYAQPFDIDVGDWVTRSVSHSIEHKVAGFEGRYLLCRCPQRMRVSLVQHVTNSRGGIFRCVICDEGEIHESDNE